MNNHDTTKPVAARRYSADGAVSNEDAVTVEAALHLKVNGEAYSTTMRTPGDDEALARGLLFTEGIVTDPAVALEFREIADPESGGVACLEISLAEEEIEKPVEGRRTMLSASSCGVCGTRDPSDIAVYGPRLQIDADDKLAVGAIPDLFDHMREHQPTFDESGGSHAAAAFDEQCELMTVKEDIGRHNAVDKVVGTLLSEGTLNEAQVLCVSGRVSYEIVYKAYRAGIPFLLAVSAPSTLAIETAERLGMTLIAFCREDRATVYSHGENVVE